MRSIWAVDSPKDCAMDDSSSELASFCPRSTSERYPERDTGLFADLAKRLVVSRAQVTQHMAEMASARNETSLASSDCSGACCTACARTRSESSSCHIRAQRGLTLVLGFLWPHAHGAPAAARTSPRAPLSRRELPDTSPGSLRGRRGHSLEFPLFFGECHHFHSAAPFSCVSVPRWSTLIFVDYSCESAESSLSFCRIQYTTPRRMLSLSPCRRSSKAPPFAWSEQIQTRLVGNSRRRQVPRRLVSVRSRDLPHRWSTIRRHDRRPPAAGTASPFRKPSGAPLRDEQPPLGATTRHPHQNRRLGTNVVCHSGAKKHFRRPRHTHESIGQQASRQRLGRRNFETIWSRNMQERPQPFIALRLVGGSPPGSRIQS